MFTYSEGSPSCFVVALIYLGRVKKSKLGLALNSNTMQRLLLVSVMIATKYLEDTSINNARWYTFLKELFSLSGPS